MLLLQHYELLRIAENEGGQQKNKRWSSKGIDHTWNAHTWA